MFNRFRQLSGIEEAGYALIVSDKVGRVFYSELARQGSIRPAADQTSKQLLLTPGHLITTRVISGNVSQLRRLRRSSYMRPR